MMITPNKATVIKDGKEIEVTLDEINKEDIVLCRPGEKIAVDGEIVEGSTHIDESFITGESVPAKKEIGNKVVAGSINYEGTIKYKAEKIGKESTVSEIVRMVVEATNTKAPIAKIADKISGYFVPAIIAIAIVSAVIWLALGEDISFVINTFVTVLVVACPCSLGLATPLAIVISSGEASKRGILIKNSEGLENSHKVKTVVFDKTGTLTNGKLGVSKIYNYTGENIDNNNLLKIIASIENKSEHPIAKGIVNYAVDNNLQLEEVEEFTNIPGYGVKAQYQGKSYLIGNSKLMKENNVDMSKALSNEEELEKDGNSILFASEENVLIALIGVKDTIKEHAIEVVETLKKQEIEVVMLTGDNEKTARTIADKIGIAHVISNVLPKEKAEKVKELKQNGLVMMCGDGINDSVSLVTADIGVAVGGGTDIAMDSSDIVLMNDDLRKINELMYISKKTIRNIKQNLFWAFFYNVCMIPIAVGIFSPFGITMNPMFASIAMTLSSLTVTLNSLRLKKI